MSGTNGTNSVWDMGMQSLCREILHTVGFWPFNWYLWENLALWLFLFLDIRQEYWLQGSFNEHVSLCALRIP